MPQNIEFSPSKNIGDEILDSLSKIGCDVSNWATLQTKKQNDRGTLSSSLNRQFQFVVASENVEISSSKFLSSNKFIEAKH